MSDLYIDGAMLERVRRNFRDIESLLSKPARDLAALSGSEIGPSVLVTRADEFNEEWEYGIGELGEFSGSVVEALDAIEKAFDEADTNLADALNDANEKG